MTSLSERNLIQRVQRELTRGAPIPLTALAQLGVSNSLASYYVRHGWLERIAHGLYAFPNDSLDRAASLRYLQKLAPGLHVGGKTALSWRGVRHYLGHSQPLVLWGTRRWTLPAWFTQRFPARYRATPLFDATIGPDTAIGFLPDPGSEGVRVAEPERALLEMLSEVGVKQTLGEAAKLVESTRTLRPELLGQLLEHCVSSKTVRLATSLPARAGLPWAEKLAAMAPASRSGRWVRRLADGSTLIIK